METSYGHNNNNNKNFNKNKLAKQIKELTKKYEENVSLKMKGQVKVFTRFVFDRIIDIDSKTERFDADVIIQCSWFDDEVLKLLLNPKLDKNYSEY